MIKNLLQIDAKTLEDERLKGARLSVYFRWAFITLIVLLWTVQLFMGYKSESLHSLVLIGIYVVSNLILWLAVRHNYNPRYLSFVSAVIDAGIVTYHLFILTAHYDAIAITSAATIFLFPVVFLLYTFRVDRGLLIFLVLLSVFLFNGVYYYHFSLNPELYQGSLSLSPISHVFKSFYILFAGFLCVYLQHSITIFIDKLMTVFDEKTKVDTEYRIEQEKSKYIQKLVEHERIQNKNLEKIVQERTEELTKANTQLLKLQKENLQSQFEVLKQQVNPHFLFNSLNVLTSLIKIDADLAETFTEQLSKVYRYVLENKDKDIVPLRVEMEFLHAYIFLLNIRFKDKIFVNITVNDSFSEMNVVPLALQLLLENAIKHNSFSKKSPLYIDIHVSDDMYLVVANNLQNRENQMVSTGVGLENIRKRYELVSQKNPVFQMKDDKFVAQIPLLANERNV